MRKSLLLLAFLSSILSGIVDAQVTRSFPAQGQRGTLGESQPLPHVNIGNRVLRLSPGAVIFDQHNRTIVHAHLPAGADVFYTQDAGGNIMRLYVLTEQEKTRLDQARQR